MQDLLKAYGSRKRLIRKRLAEFRSVWRGPEGRLFEEFCFCLFTPMTKARNCDRAVNILREKDLLFGGNEFEVRKSLRRIVRFHNTKSKYLVGNRKMFFANGSSLKDSLENLDSQFEMREWLVRNVKGFGYKEASHFLRNIGFTDLAILDRHIMRNLVKYGAIRKMPKTLTRKNYISIEGKMKKFSEKTGIPLDELDLLFWSMETGEVFK
ncbi:MAG: N-glycosylase/DNA lyase, partial [Candidatus Aenigmarchaeota archaeon]|nr:N-glycosylase/DNA lyase [Candidatus Aenigmarchaeota archaeon]